MDGMTLANLAKAETVSDRLAIEIKALLARRSQSQSALAGALGVPAMWVSDRLSGKTQINVNDLARVAEVLGIEPWDLLRAAEGVATIRYDSDRDLWPHRPNVRQAVDRPRNRTDGRSPIGRRAHRTNQSVRP